MAVGNCVINNFFKKMQCAEIKGEAVVYLMGGLGNNLFQLNLAHELVAFGLNVKINTGLLEGGNLISKILGWTDHRSHNLLDELGLLKSFELIETPPILILILGYLSKIFRRKFFNVKFYGLELPERRHAAGGHYFGYYHNIDLSNQKFAIELKNGINNAMQKRQYIWKDISDVRSTAMVVHMRGGDFVMDSKNLLDSKFYSDALELIDRSITPDLLIATNDRNYAAKMLGLRVLRFTSSRDALDDFIIISQAKSKILSNSTFAWWAAEIGSLDSMVIEVSPYYVGLDWHPKSVHKRISILRS